MSVNAVNAASMMPMLKLVKAMNKGKENAANKPAQRQQASAQQQSASRKNAQGREGDLLKQLAQVLTGGAQQGSKGSQLRSGLQQGGAQKGGLQNAEGAGSEDLAASQSMMESQLMEFIGELKKILSKLKGKGDMRKLGDALSKSDNPMAKSIGAKLTQASESAEGAEGTDGEKTGGCCGKKDNAEGSEMSGAADTNASTGLNNLRKAQGNDASDDPSTDNLRGATGTAGAEQSGFDQIPGEGFEDFLFRVMAQITKDLQEEIRDQVKKIKALSAASAAAGAAGGPAATVAADSKMLAMEKLKQLTQKLQQAFQALSNVMNNMHNGAMNSIRNIK